jgi:hypothetical protein
VQLEVGHDPVVVTGHHAVDRLVEGEPAVDDAQAGPVVVAADEDIVHASSPVEVGLVMR